MSKLNCLLIGNCQNTGVMHYLSQSEEFNKTYEMKQYTNWQLIRNNCEIPMQDIKNADLFIFQPLRIVHGCYSTDPTVEGSIGYYVKDDCIKVSYPYIFSSSMWPLVQKGQNQNVWFGGEVINKLISNGLKREDILNLYDQNKIDWEYKNRFEKSINILKEKESITDVKVSNFIEQNLRNILLFLIPQHPTSVIFLNVANQILAKLGMEQLDCEERTLHFVNEVELPDSTYNHPLNMHPLHKSLIEDLGFTFGEEYLNDSHEFYRQRVIDYFNLNGYS